MQRLLAKLGYSLSELPDVYPVETGSIYPGVIHHEFHLTFTSSDTAAACLLADDLQGYDGTAGRPFLVDTRLLVTVGDRLRFVADIG